MPMESPEAIEPPGRLKAVSPIKANVLKPTKNPIRISSAT